MARTFSDIRLVNGSTGDPVLYIDYPGQDDGFLFDAGDNARLPTTRLSDLEALFITHHHIDHFMGLDRIVRANLDRDKTLHVFGPPGTIRKVYDRVTSYAHPFFPFQKLVLEVRDIHSNHLDVARLECAKRFPEPEVEQVSWTGPLLYTKADRRVEVVPVDHSVPCLAYALVETAGYHLDPDKLERGLLRRGAWIGEALDLLQSGASSETMLEIGGGQFKLGKLAEAYFTTSKGSRVAFVTDTLWSEASRPGLLKLAHRAARLYCDCFYAQAQLKQAQTYRHMIATQTAEFAVQVKAERLILMHFSQRYVGKYQTLIDEARAIFPGAEAEIETTTSERET